MNTVYCLIETGVGVNKVISASTKQVQMVRASVLRNRQQRHSNEGKLYYSVEPLIYKSKKGDTVTLINNKTVQLVG